MKEHFSGDKEFSRTCLHYHIVSGNTEVASFLLKNFLEEGDLLKGVSYPGDAFFDEMMHENSEKGLELTRKVFFRWGSLQGKSLVFSLSKKEAREQMRGSFKKLWRKRVLSALDLAILSGRVDLLKVLLERISISNICSFVFHLAMYSSNPKVFQVLRKSKKCQIAWNAFYLELVQDSKCISSRDNVSSYVQLMIVRGCAVNLPLIVCRENANERFIYLEWIKRWLRETYTKKNTYEEIIDEPESFTFTQVAMLLYSTENSPDGIDPDIDPDTGEFISIALWNKVLSFPVNVNYAKTSYFFLKRRCAWWKRSGIDGREGLCLKDCLFLRCVDRTLSIDGEGWRRDFRIFESVFTTVLFDRLLWDYTRVEADSPEVFYVFCHLLLKINLFDMGWGVSERGFGGLGNTFLIQFLRAYFNQEYTCKKFAFAPYWFFHLKPFFEKGEMWKNMGDSRSSPIRVLVELLSVHPSWGLHLSRPGGFEYSVSVKRAKLFSILFEIASGAGIPLEVFLPPLLEGVEYLEKNPESVLFSRNFEARQIKDDFGCLRQSDPVGVDLPLILNRESYSAIRTLWNIWWIWSIGGTVSWLKSLDQEALLACEAFLCPPVLSSLQPTLPGEEQRLAKVTFLLLERGGVMLLPIFKVLKDTLKNKGINFSEFSQWPLDDVRWIFYYMTASDVHFEIPGGPTSGARERSELKCAGKSWFELLKERRQKQDLHLLLGPGDRRVFFDLFIRNTKEEQDFLLYLEEEGALSLVVDCYAGSATPTLRRFILQMFKGLKASQNREAIDFCLYLANHFFSMELFQFDVLRHPVVLDCYLLWMFKEKRYGVIEEYVRSMESSDTTPRFSERYPLAMIFEHRYSGLFFCLSS